MPSSFSVTLTYRASVSGWVSPNSSFQKTGLRGQATGQKHSLLLTPLPPLQTVERIKGFQGPSKPTLLLLDTMNLRSEEKSSSSMMSKPTVTKSGIPASHPDQMAALIHLSLSHGPQTAPSLILAVPLPACPPPSLPIACFFSQLSSAGQVSELSLGRHPSASHDSSPPSFSCLLDREAVLVV